MIRVILCDDHAMIRRGIKDTLSEEQDIQVVAETGSYAEVREALRTHPCDVLVLDINLPGRDGLDVLASLRETDVPVKVLMVSMFPEDQYALRCLKAGAQGYLNKAGDPSDLVNAVRTISLGRKYVSPEVAQMLVDNLHTPQHTTLHASLSERELQTLLKIASGKRLSDIADELMLSPKTVSVYRARVLEKLKLSNNAELTVYATRSRTGGMNHFMLPEGDGIEGGGRYGSYAMELLINKLLKSGARRENMQAKVFGGAQVMAGFTSMNVGERNTNFVLDYLCTERIPVVSQDVLDIHPRKVCFFPVTGKALVKRLAHAHPETLVIEERKGSALTVARTTSGGSIDLF